MQRDYQERCSKVVRDEPCPSCRSMGRDRTGNHLMVFEDGGKYCNRCGHRESPTDQQEAYEEDTLMTLSLEEAVGLPYPTEYRGIHPLTYEQYGVRAAYDTGSAQMSELLFPFYSQDGDLIGYKVRSLTQKKFFAVGTLKAEGGPMLWGQHAVPKAGQRLLITEGELDALSAAQTLYNSKYFNYWPSVVSVPNGAQGALQSIQDNLEFVSGYGEVIIAFDKDEAGQDATAKVCSLLGAKATVSKF